MAKINIAPSEYKGSICIANCASFEKVVDVKYVSRAEDLPQFVGYISPKSVSNHSVEFDVEGNVSPFYIESGSSVSIHKYIDETTSTISKGENLRKEKKQVILSYTTEKPFLFSDLIDLQRVYYASVEVENISNIVFTNDDTGLFSELFKFKMFHEGSFIARIFPNYNKNTLDLYFYTEQYSNTIDVEIEYTTLINNVSYSPTYYVIPTITFEYADSYDIQFNCYSTKQGVLDQYGISNFYCVPDFITFREPGKRTVYFQYPFTSEEICIPSSFLFSQYNIYEKRYGVTLIDASISGFPTIAYPFTNTPGAKKEERDIDIIEFDLFLNGQPSIPVNIDVPVYGISAIDTETGDTLSVGWDTLNRAMTFGRKFKTRLYHIYFIVQLPLSYFSPLFVKHGTERLKDISLYKSNLLENNSLSILYSEISGYTMVISNESTELTNEIGTIYSIMNQNAKIYISDMRSYTEDLGEENRIGSTPYDKTIVPLDISNYIIVDKPMKEFYKKTMFDIDTRPVNVFTYMQERKPFYTKLEILDIESLSANIDFNISYEFIGEILSVMITIDSTSNEFFYIINNNKVMSGALLKPQTFNSNVIDRYEQDQFVDDLYITKQKRFTTIYAIGMSDYSGGKNLITLDFSVGLYNVRYNYYGQPIRKSMEIMVEGLGRGNWSDDVYGAKS